MKATIKNLNGNKHRTEISPNIYMKFQDMERKTESEERDAVLQIQINKLQHRLTMLEQNLENGKNGRNKQTK